MTNEKTYLKLPTAGLIIFLLLLTATSFYAGFSWIKIKNNTPTITAQNAANAIAYTPQKSDKPQFQFFVMSFCPYGNQAEDIIKPVVDLLGDKVEFKPQYIFDKITDLNDYCSQRSGDPSKCSQYIDNGYFKTDAECKQTINDNLVKCKDEKQYLKTSNGSVYASLHGRQEATQNVRELCAYKYTDNKKDWWSFVDNVNQNCSDQNADSCWEEQAKKANLDTGKISECFNKEAFDLIEAEIKETDSKQVSGSPSLFINGLAFPPESAYTQDGKGTIKIGKSVFSQDQFRTPEVIKQAICAGFNKSPKECKTILESTTDNAAAAAGGC